MYAVIDTRDQTGALLGIIVRNCATMAEAIDVFCDRKKAAARLGKRMRLGKTSRLRLQGAADTIWWSDGRLSEGTPVGFNDEHLDLVSDIDADEWACELALRGMAEQMAG